MTDIPQSQSVAQTTASTTINIYRNNPKLKEIISELEKRETWVLSQIDASTAIKELCTLSHMREMVTSPEQDDLNALTAATSYLHSNHGTHILRLFCNNNAGLQDDLLHHARFEVDTDGQFAPTAQIFLGRIRILLVHQLFGALFDVSRINYVKQILNLDTEDF